MEIRHIGISTATSVTFSAQLASLQVALHVTKRQNGANASDRLSVMVGSGGCHASNEAGSSSVSGGLAALAPGVRRQRVT